MAPSARFTEDFAYEVLSVVGEIPEGTVATYGQIARLIVPVLRKPRSEVCVLGQIKHRPAGHFQMAEHVAHLIMYRRQQH